MFFIVSRILAQCISSASGQGTFYDVFNSAENDGYTGQFRCPIPVPSDGIYAAIASSCFESGNSACGKMVTVNYNGKSIQVPILDECATCDDNHIDLSIGAFKALERNMDIGVLKGLSWSASAPESMGLRPTVSTATNHVNEKPKAPSVNGNNEIKSASASGSSIHKNSLPRYGTKIHGSKSKSYGYKARSCRRSRKRRQ
eukprot:NODE_106_length_19857_cov_0.799980.p10 type:complete len:200 gc:universal NODE_106_length_19857_cov_0.799980:3104-3703(+)